MKNIGAGLIVLSWLVLSGLGCDQRNQITDALTSSLAPPPPPAKEEAVSWKSVGEGVERLELQFATSTQGHMILYRFPADGFTWRMDQGDSKRVGEWMPSATGTALVMNGAYFHEDQKPSGLLISRGKRIGTRQFDLDKSGFIELAPKVRLFDTKKDKLETKMVTEGAQSYPFLILDGKIAIGTDSQKFARRSFFGTDSSGRVYVGIAPDEPLSLYELAATLVKLDVSWDRVLNLDGGPSSGLAFRSSSSNETWDSYTVVPNVIIAEKK